MENPAVLNGVRPTEIHAIAVWNGTPETELPPWPGQTGSRLRLIDRRTIPLSGRTRFAVSKSVYGHKNLVASTVELLILEDTNPIYSFSAVGDLSNETLRTVAADCSRRPENIYVTQHIQQTVQLLTPLGLDDLIPRPVFTDFNDFFDRLNSDPHLNYLVQRNFRDIEQPMKFFKKKNDIDVLVNDYYYFKAITGARSVHPRLMRENRRWNIQSRIRIAGVEVAFDIRYAGDHYFDGPWEFAMLDRRISRTMATGVVISVPALEDELYTLLFHLLLQKPEPTKSRHIPQVQQLRRESGWPEYDFSDLPSVRADLDRFMATHGYRYSTPADRALTLRL